MRSLPYLLRIVLVPLHAFGAALSQLVARLEKPRYLIRGSCLRCGNCCHHLLLVEAPFLTWPVLRVFSRWWLERVYHFAITDNAIEDPDDGELYRVLHCRLASDGPCPEYRLRPRICREWPMPSSVDPPVLFEGCGYRAVERQNQAGCDVSRRRTPAPPGQIAGMFEAWKSVKK